MKKFRAGDPATRRYIDQRPTSSEKHDRKDGYIPTRLRTRSEKALRDGPTNVRQEDISVLLTSVAFGDVKKYRSALRANVEIINARNDSFCL